MRRVSMAALLLTVPVLAGVLTLAGCSSGNKESQQGDVSPPAEGKAHGRGEGGRAEKTEVASTGWGTLKGKVTFEGGLPEIGRLKIDKDNEVCDKGDTKDQTWKIGGPDHGVGDVVIWLRAPKNHYFKISDEDKKVDRKVKLDQPFCSFIPHVLALYPSYYDGKSKKQVRTGETLEITNSAKIPHNTNYAPGPGADPILIAGDNKLLPPGQDFTAGELSASSPTKVGGEQFMVIKCNIHSWMKAFGWVFDHPYFAITGGDQPGQNYGAYEIKKAPAGAEVELVYWHETMPEPKVLKKITLKEGDNTENFTVGGK